MTNRVKVGIVGAGGISYTYLKNLTETFHITEVVGIADIIEERSKRRAEQFHKMCIRDSDCRFGENRQSKKCKNR